MCKTEQAQTLHHCDYTKRNLLGAALELMFPICRNCHQAIELLEWDGGIKTEPAQVALLSGFFRECLECGRVKPSKGWKSGGGNCPACVGMKAYLAQKNVTEGRSEEPAEP